MKAQERAEALWSQGEALTESMFQREIKAAERDARASVIEECIAILRARASLSASRHTTGTLEGIVEDLRSLAMQPNKSDAGDGVTGSAGSCNPPRPSASDSLTKRRDVLGRLTALEDSRTNLFRDLGNQLTRIVAAEQRILDLMRLRDTDIEATEKLTARVAEREQIGESVAGLCLKLEERIEKLEAFAGAAISEKTEVICSKCGHLPSNWDTFAKALPGDGVWIGSCQCFCHGYWVNQATPTLATSGGAAKPVDVVTVPMGVLKEYREAAEAYNKNEYESLYRLESAEKALDAAIERGGA